MTTKKTVKNPTKSDFVIPDNAEWGDTVCPGAVGSPANLTDIEAQYQENVNALREKRKARALAVHCPFCSKYHIEMQPAVESLVGGEIIGNYVDTSPPPPEEPVTSETALAAGVAAVSGISEKNKEDDDLDDLGLE